ncbi:MAG: YlxR family protein [Vampirovibrionales bacterium]|nr:YlxR family protein [Vampirovibrionales bacterium]
MRLRQCVACREKRPQEALHKITARKTPLAFSVNDQPPINGRSAYVCRHDACMKSALKGKRLQKALKRAIPDDILEGLLGPAQPRDAARPRL